MDMKSILAALSAAAQAAETLGPALQIIGIPQLAGAERIAGAALSVAETVRDAIQSHEQIEAAEEDQAALEGIIDRLKAKANALGAEIDAS